MDVFGFSGLACHSPSNMLLPLFPALLVLSSSVSCAPTQEYERRQLNGLLGSALGFLRINATFDYIIVGGYVPSQIVSMES